MSFAERGIARGIRRTAPTGFSHFSHFPRIARTYATEVVDIAKSTFKIWPFIKRRRSRHMVSPNLPCHLSASGMKIYFTLTGVFSPRFIARIFGWTSKNYIKEVGVRTNFCRGENQARIGDEFKDERFLHLQMREITRNPRQLIIDRFLNSIGNMRIRVNKTLRNSISCRGKS